MKKLLFIFSLFLFISGCSLFNIKENRVNTELYLIQSNLSPDSILEKIKNSKLNYDIEDLIKKLPKNSNSKFLYKTTIEQISSDSVEVIDLKFYPNETLFNFKEQAYLKFKLEPLFLKNDKTTQTINYEIKIFVGIENYIDKTGNKIYIPVYQKIINSNNIIVNNEYNILSVIQLSNGSNIIFINKSKLIDIY